MLLFVRSSIIRCALRCIRFYSLLEFVFVWLFCPCVLCSVYVVLAIASSVLFPFVCMRCWSLTSVALPRTLSSNNRTSYNNSELNFKTGVHELRLKVRLLPLHSILQRRQTTSATTLDARQLWRTVRRMH